MMHDFDSLFVQSRRSSLIEATTLNIRIRVFISKTRHSFGAFALGFLLLFSSVLNSYSKPSLLNSFPFANSQTFAAEFLISPGDLDSSFNGRGIRTDGYGNGADEIYGTALQSDGKIVVVGRSGIGARFPAIVTRYNTDGSLDSSFNLSGSVSLLNAMATAFAVRIQPDGKIVVVGSVFTGQFSDFAVIRLNSNGTFDSTFDDDGIVATSINARNDVAFAVSIQSDGKIVVAGSDENPNLSLFREFAVVRYNSDGSLDSSFGFGGKKTTLLTASSEARAVALQPDGKIVVAGAGEHLAGVVRYNLDGTLDSTFDGDGIATLSSYSAYSIALQTDGKIVLGGSPTSGNIDLTVIRFNTDGSLDTTFDGDGIARAPENFGTHISNAIVIGAGEKITAVGEALSEFIAVRFNSDGSLDTNFGNSGKASAVFNVQRVDANGAAIAPDGRLVIAGFVQKPNSATDFALARFNLGGNLDLTFGSGGMTTNDIGDGEVYTMAVAVQSDGKIVTAGRHFIPDSVSANWNFAISRYNANGSLDTTFDVDGKVSIGVFDNVSDYATSMAIQPDGKIIVAGYIGETTLCTLVRLNPDGSPDSSFNGNGRVFTSVGSDRSYANSVALQSNGKIVIGGYSHVGSSTDFSAVRYNSDGSLDTSFNGTGIVITPVGNVSDQANSVLVQPDGKVVLAGTSGVNGVGNFAMVRYNEDGTLDSSFGVGGKVLTLAGTTSSLGFAASLQTDGKILVGGGSIISNVGFALARYNADGALDAGFGSNGIVNTQVNATSQINALKVQPNGKIIAVGESTAIGQNGYDFAIVRYDSNGSLDPSWGNAGKVITNISGIQDNAYAVAIDQSGNIVVAGRAGGLSGVVRYFGDPVNSTRKTLFDFDGDSKTDLGIFRPAMGEWWYQKSSNGGNFAAQFGASTDRIVPADYTGDGKTDFAFFRPSSGQWFVLRSEDFSFFAFPFGVGTDIPVPADYDGDGKADAAVFRPSTLTWFIQKSSGGTDILAFGASGDKPVVGDYDGDGKADIAIFRPNGANGAEWWIRRSSNASVFALQFGISTDKPVQGDYTGDGKADVAVWRPSNGNWFILRSEDFSYFSFPFGANGDVPVAGDYDGDGKFDAGVFRPTSNSWFIQRSTAGLLIQQFGTTGDLPVPSAFVP
ncbi:MAG: VCBS repeat-containing protein [Acidobacteria bacterium]|nr:VCBS repeat-containing protein [Acidobacteriota bacterium]